MHGAGQPLDEVVYPVQNLPPVDDVEVIDHEHRVAGDRGETVGEDRHPGLAG